MKKKKRVNGEELCKSMDLIVAKFNDNFHEKASGFYNQINKGKGLPSYRQTDSITSKSVIQFICNRYNLMSSVLPTLPSGFLEFFWKSNDCRIALLTKGGVVTKKNGEYDIEINDKFTVYDEGDDLVNELDDSEEIFTWGGCGLVLPEKVITLLNLEIKYPVIYITHKTEDDFNMDIGIYERDWGLDLITSDNGLLKSNGKNITKNNKEVNPKFGITDGNGEKTEQFAHFSLELLEKLIERDIQITVELPLKLTNQDSLTMISADKKTNEKMDVVASTCC